ncbi:hypothetical protein TUM17377_34610 [Shewanella chilikensis]|nr:hypothetical protein TUM17377_34610 [Shewanella chilikensis]GHA92610.1 hypothetical protein GCM10007107_01770 [Shewanella indica]
MALMKIQHAEFDSPLAAMKHSDQAGQIDFALVGKKIDGLTLEQVLKLAQKPSNR